MRRSIELYLYRLECQQDAERYDRVPLSDDELALADGDEAWRGTRPW